MKVIEVTKSQRELSIRSPNDQLCKNIYLSDMSANFPPPKYKGFSTKPS